MLILHFPELGAWVTMVRTKRRWMAGLVTATICVGLALGCGIWYHRHYVRLDGKCYSRLSQQLDLSGVQGLDYSTIGQLDKLEELDLRGTGITLAEYQQLQGQLPNCQILWEVPFQGRFLSLDTTQLELTQLAQEEVEALSYLEGLTQVDAWSCRDYAALAALNRALPHCQVGYRVTLGDVEADSLADTLILESGELSQVQQALAVLPNVRKVVFAHALPDVETVSALEQAFPQVTLAWQYGPRNLPLGQAVDYLDLRGGALTLKQARLLLACCPGLRQANLKSCGLTTEEMLALCEEFPHCAFTWNVTFDDRVYSSDAVEIDLTGLSLDDPAWLEARVKYMPNLKKVILTGCTLSDEALDSLNLRHADIQFVWTVQLGPVSLRTDAIFFAPVVTDQHVTQGQLDALKYCRDLVAIDLGHMHITDCAWATNMPKLKYLILADSGVRDLTPLANCGELVFLELFLTPAQDYSPLLACKKLEDLNLCYCRGSADPVKKMTWLKRL